MNAFDEAPDPRVLWPIDMSTVTTYEDLVNLSDGQDVIVVTELAWDPRDPYEVKVVQREQGCESNDDAFAVFDVEMIRQVIETYGPVGQGRVRLECTRPGESFSATPKDGIWVAITIEQQGCSEIYFTPMWHLIGFAKAIHGRRSFEPEPEPPDWDTGLRMLVGGTP